jgi:hypothetical protein
MLGNNFKVFYLKKQCLFNLKKQCLFRHQMKGHNHILNSKVEKVQSANADNNNKLNTFIKNQ